MGNEPRVFARVTRADRNPDRHTAIYVVVGGEILNDRVEKLISLDIQNATVVLVQPGKNTVGTDKITVRPYPNLTGLLRPAGLEKLKQKVDRLLYFPSSRTLLVRPMLRLLRRRIARDFEEGRDVTLLTCLPPHDLCLLGLSLKQGFHRLYWLVDWQDLWSYDENYFERIARPYRKRLLELERQAQARCDMNLTTNAYAKAVLEQHYQVPADRVTAIPHHFSRDDLDYGPGDIKPALKAEQPATLRLGFLGTLFKPPRVPGELLYAALRQINTTGQRVELHVHGKYPKHLSREAVVGMRNDGLWFHGPSSHRESLKALLGYDFLVLLLGDLPNSRAVMSIKLPHYLSIGIPIIAIVPDPSAVADVVRQTGAGYVVPTASDWQSQLIDILRGECKALRPQRNEAAIESFSWASLSQRWVDVLTPAQTVHKDN